MLEPLVAASVEVFRRVSSCLLPTPSRSHYVFSLRDVGKALQVWWGARAHASTCVPIASITSADLGRKRKKGHLH
jgi:hypothetical protein